MTSSPPPAPSDDPTGGRRLTRRLRRVLPIAALLGLVPGIATALAVGDWRPALMIPLGIVALAGTVTAAVEDGRVQRGIDARRPPSERNGSPPP